MRFDTPCLVKPCCKLPHCSTVPSHPVEVVTSSVSLNVKFQQPGAQVLPLSQTLGWDYLSLLKLALQQTLTVFAFIFKLHLNRVDYFMVICYLSMSMGFHGMETQELQQN